MWLAAAGSHIVWKALRLLRSGFLQVDSKFGALDDSR